MPTNWHLRTLGQLSLHPESPDAPPVLSNAKALAVLAYLSRVPGHEAGRDHLASLVWPGMEGTRARRCLRQALYYLSQKADDGLVDSVGDDLHLVDHRLNVDVLRFDAALEKERWETALELYGGPFLKGYGRKAGRELEGWIESQNERVWAGFKSASYELVEEALQAGRTDRAVEFARRYVELNPLDEAAQRVLIEALLSADERVEAYRQYEGYRALLREELGVEPGEDLEETLRALQEKLFRTEPGPSTADERTSQTVAEIRSDGTEARRAGQGDTGRALLLISAATVLMGAAFSAGWIAQSTNAQNGWKEASGSIPLYVDSADERKAAVLSVKEGEARLAGDAFSSRRLISPEGDLEARHVRTMEGPDVHVVDRETGATVATVAGQPDESPVAWAPDGRSLLYQSGQGIDDGRGYERSLHVLDLDDMTRRKLPVPPLSKGPSRPVWSPRGPHIAYMGAEPNQREPDVFVVAVDGGGLANLSRHAVWDGDPAWSPDGDWLAFSSRRAGTADIYLVQANGAGLERITFGTKDERYPIWVSPDHVAFVVLPANAGPGECGALRLLNVTTRQSRALLDAPSVCGISPNRRRPARAVDAMIEQIEIRGVPRVVNPGRWLPLSFDVRTASEGTESPVEPSLVNWSVGDTQVVRILTDSSAVVRGEGQTTLHVSVGGWRSDTVRLSSRQVVTRDRRAFLEESWQNGIRQDQWVRVGDPLPVVQSVGDGGDSVHAMLNRGDANYESGVVSRRAFPVGKQGITLQFRARMKLRGGPWESLIVGLTRSELRGDPMSWPQRSENELDVTLRPVRGTNHSRVTFPSGAQAIPHPSHPDQWTVYALQVEPDGHISWVEDGRIRWRSSAPDASEIPSTARVFLGGRAVKAQVQISDLLVLQGVKYMVP